MIICLNKQALDTEGGVFMPQFLHYLLHGHFLEYGMELDGPLCY